MLKRSRVSGAFDASRLAQLVRGPGIDTRSWASLAIVTKIVVDSAHGPFADIVLLPSQQEATARIGSCYAGNGFGVWCPPLVDDEVLVAAPSGDPAEGLVIVQRLWSKSDPPAAEMNSAPTDVLLRIEKDRSVRLLTSGAGKVIIGSEDSDVDVTSGGDIPVNAGGDVAVTTGGKVALNTGLIEHSVARVDDATADGTFSMTAVPDPGGTQTTITFTYLGQAVGSESQLIGTIILLTAGGTATAGTPAALTGLITSGNDKVKA